MEKKTITLFNPRNARYTNMRNSTRPKLLKSLSELSKKILFSTLFNIVLRLKKITDSVLKHKGSNFNIQAKGFDHVDPAGLSLSLNPRFSYSARFQACSGHH
jgi:hypothetical protein